jgi:hypothetical protein
MGTLTRRRLDLGFSPRPSARYLSRSNIYCATFWSDHDERGRVEPNRVRYFVTSPHDDETGVMTTLGATPWREQIRRTHAFVTTPGMLAVVNAVLAGLIAARAASVVGTGPAIATAVGVLGFLTSYAALYRYTLKQIALFRRWNQPRLATVAPALPR